MSKMLEHIANALAVNEAGADGYAPTLPHHLGLARMVLEHMRVPTDEMLLSAIAPENVRDLGNQMNRAEQREGDTLEWMIRRPRTDFYGSVYKNQGAGVLFSAWQAMIDAALREDVG